MNTPTEEPPPGDDDMVQHYQFSAISSPGIVTQCYGNGLKNLAYYGGEYFYGRAVLGGRAALSTLELDSVTSLTDSSATVESFKAATVDIALTNIICRNFGDDIYAAASLENGGSTYLLIIYTTDGGQNFTTLERTYTVAGGVTTGAVLDIINLGGVVYVIFSHCEVGNYDLVAHNIAANTNTFMTHLSGYNQVAGGNVIADVWYFFLHLSTGELVIDQFDGVTTSELEGAISITDPTWDVDEQMLYISSTTYIILMKDYIYVRGILDTTASWVEYTDSTYTWGVIWDHNSDADYIVNYFIFNGSIWKIMENGVPVRIQAFAANAGHGYEDWFTDGTDIFQATLITLSDWKNAKVAMALYTVPQLTYQSQTEPFDEQLLEIYEDDYAVDPSILTEFDAALTGWTDVSGAGCSNAYEASFAGVNHTIAHVIKFTDNSNTALTQRYKTIAGTERIFSAWLAIDTNAVEGIYLSINNTGTAACQVLLWNGAVRHYVGAVLTDSGVPVVVNTWYHVCVSLDIDTDLYKFWVNGVYIGEFAFYTAVAAINRVYYGTNTVSPSIPYIGRAACPYAGTSLAEALSSYWAYQDPRLLFRGYVSNVTTDGTAFVVTALDPIAIDLERPVTVTYAAQTAHYILKDIIDTYCLHLWYNTGISTTPATTYSVVFQETSILEIIRFCDSVESYQTSIRPSGEVYWDTYVEVGHALDDGSLIQALPLVSKDTRKFGRFVLFGGLDITTGAPFKSVILQNVNFDTHTDELPSIRDQTALDAANLKIATAKNISLKKLTFHSGRSPVIYPGEEAIITLPQHSIAGATWYCITSNYDIDQKRYEHVLTDAYWQPPTYVTYRNNLPSAMWANLRSLLTEEQLRYLMAHAKDFEDRITALE